ncbi:putative BAH domain, Agenet-like domain, Agenet domain, plant type [Dioscorea sansibarensis]
MVVEGYAAWEEIEVSTDKGRREVHFYLKRGDGLADLAVVGREKSVRHMAYHVTSQFLRTALAVYMSAPSVSSGAARFSFKWRSKREVVDWLKTFISASHPYKSSSAVDRFLDDDDDDDDEIADIAPPKDLSRHRSKDFSWLGSAWNCRKRRKHYRSFCRNGITVSVHDFVYIMAEDCKRLVAYVEDLYEDLRANRMVVVRWFHKVDEVAVVLPPDINDREIFFSLCLQDFSVECIDGLAAVLSTQHFVKFQNEARHGNWEPYLCRRQIDNDDIKPFDVTQVQGYWSQELLRSMYTSSRKLKLKITYGGSNLDRENDSVSLSGTKRKQRSSNVDISAKVFHKSRTFGNGSRAEVQAPDTISAAPVSKEELLKQKFQKMLYPGCNVEVLSQDSGVRGCWFRCVVLKKHQDKVKVRYQDILDADETGNLEEWVLASRIAVADKLGIRLSGRQIVRPQRTDKGVIQCSFNAGAVVDAWWNDGWWEGIVICKESEQKIHVYFPDERRASTFRKDDLRHSQDWVCFQWENIKDRPDISSSVLPNLASDGGIPPLVSSEQDGQPESDHAQAEETQSAKKVKCEPRSSEEPLVQEQNVPNLVKDCMRNGLRWISSRKRRRGRDQDKGGLVCKRPSDGSCCSIQDEAAVSLHRGQFLLPKSMTIDHDNCKGGGDLLFNAPMSVSNLVMSR